MFSRVEYNETLSPDISFTFDKVLHSAHEERLADDRESKRSRYNDEESSIRTRSRGILYDMHVQWRNGLSGDNAVIC